jgi:hypothetical protein
MEEHEVQSISAIPGHFVSSTLRTKEFGDRSFPTRTSNSFDFLGTSSPNVGAFGVRLLKPLRL